MDSESESLKRDIEELRAAFDKLGKDVSSMGLAQAEDLKARASRTVNDIREGARAVAGEIGEKGKESLDAIEKSVRDRPIQYLLIAFGAGLLLAQLLRKR